MNNKKRRLTKLERKAKTDKVRFVFYWPGDERPEPEPGEQVIVFTWPKDDEE